MKYLFYLSFFLSFTVFAQPDAYSWFTAGGKKSSFSKMARAAAGADIVLFGELHDDPIAHWMQLLLARELYAQKGGQLLIGAEMLERDQQDAVDRFLSGALSEKQLKDSTRLWSNFQTDYLPLLRYAKEKQLQYVATNVPRVFASLVFKKGTEALDTLSEQQKEWICPLPLVIDTTLSQYASLIRMGMEMHGNGVNFAKAQAIKDATMAYSILESWMPGQTMLHLNGSYHSDFHQSICWYLLREYKGLKVVTISTVTQDNLKHLDDQYRNKADFILVTPSSMTRTM